MAAFAKTIFFLVLAAALAGAAVLVPVHFRSTDPAVVHQAEKDGDPPAVKIREYVRASHLLPARRLLRALPEAPADSEEITAQIADRLEEKPVFTVSGGPAQNFEAFLRQSGFTNEGASSIISLLLDRGKRSALVRYLEETGSNTNVSSLLGIRQLRGMSRLHPAEHPAGAPYDAGLLTLALLVEGEHILPSPARKIAEQADRAGQGDQAATSSIEALVTATLSTGRRLDYRSLANVAGFCDTPEDWLRTGELFRKHPESTDFLYAALAFGETPSRLHSYLLDPAGTRKSARGDLEKALGHGPEAVAHLLESGKPLYRPNPTIVFLLDQIEPLRPPALARLALRAPQQALLLKAGLFLAAGFLFAFALGALCRRNSGDNEALRRLSPAIFLRNSLLAVLAALGLWLLVEPGILESSGQTTETASPEIDLRLPDKTLESLQSPAQAMQELDQITLLILALFFILQLFIYVFCLIKLKEISKQKANAAMKIRLLENEENLFDLGLYVGLGGTVLALIAVVVGFAEASLMAAYASTLFGILFTAVFKVLHLRPYRRKLILEAEEPAGPAQPGSLMSDIRL